MDVRPWCWVLCRVLRLVSCFPDTLVTGHPQPEWISLTCTSHGHQITFISGIAPATALEPCLCFSCKNRSIVEWSVWTITYRPRRLFSNFSKPYVIAEHSCSIFEYLDSAWVSYRDAMATLCSFSWELLLRFPQKVQLVWKASHHRAIHHNVISDTHCTGDVCIPRQVCIGR